MQKEVKHLNHLEDLIIHGGEVQDVVNVVNDVYYGKHREHVFAQVKIDGAPALVFGCDPDDSKFFMSTKGAFNGKAKIIKYREDVWSFNPELHKRLSLAFGFLSRLNIEPGTAYQADMLFIVGDKQHEIIDGKEYLTFQPNLVKYAITAKPGFGFYEYARNASLGIVVHTKYAFNGDSYTQVPLHFKDLLKQVRSIRGLFVVDNVIKSGVQHNNKTLVYDLIDNIGADESDGFIRSLRLTHPRLFEYLIIYFNSMLDEDGGIYGHARNWTLMNCQNIFDNFIKFIQIRINKLKVSVKTDKAKQRYDNKLQDWVDFLVNNDVEFEKFLKLYYRLIQIKHLVLEDLNASLFCKSLIGDVESNEGIVVVGSNHTVKFVDRLTFSAMNRKFGRFQ